MVWTPPIVYCEDCLQRGCRFPLGHCPLGHHTDDSDLAEDCHASLVAVVDEILHDDLTAYNSRRQQLAQTIGVGCVVEIHHHGFTRAGLVVRVDDVEGRQYPQLAIQLVVDRNPGVDVKGRSYRTARFHDVPHLNDEACRCERYSTAPVELPCGGTARQTGCSHLGHAPGACRMAWTPLDLAIGRGWGPA